MKFTDILIAKHNGCIAEDIGQILPQCTIGITGLSLYENNQYTGQCSYLVTSESSYYDTTIFPINKKLMS